MRDRPRGDGHPMVAQVLIDFRQTAVLCVAQGAHPGDDIQAKLVLGQGEPSLFFGAVRAVQLRTGAIETAPNLQGEMHRGFQGGDGAIVMISRPHRLTAEGAMTPKRLEGAGGSGGRTRRRTCHREPFPVTTPYGISNIRQRFSSVCYPSFFYEAFDGFGTHTLRYFLLKQMDDLSYISRMLFEIVLCFILFFVCKLWRTSTSFFVIKSSTMMCFPGIKPMVDGDTINREDRHQCGRIDALATQ